MQVKINPIRVQYIMSSMKRYDPNLLAADTTPIIDEKSYEQDDHDQVHWQQWRWWKIQERLTFPQLPITLAKAAPVKMDDSVFLENQSPSFSVNVKAGLAIVVKVPNTYTIPLAIAMVVVTALLDTIQKMQSRHHEDCHTCQADIHHLLNPRDSPSCWQPSQSTQCRPSTACGTLAVWLAGTVFQHWCASCWTTCPRTAITSRPTPCGDHLDHVDRAGPHPAHTQGQHAVKAISPK